MWQLYGLCTSNVRKWTAFKRFLTLNLLQANWSCWKHWNTWWNCWSSFVMNVAEVVDRSPANLLGSFFCRRQWLQNTVDPSSLWLTSTIIMQNVRDFKDVMEVSQFFRIHCRSFPHFPHKLNLNRSIVLLLAAWIELESHLLKIYIDSQSAHW